MQTSKLTDWQNPFVDVFKRYNTFETLEQAMKGNVTVIHVKYEVSQDPGIARKCIKLSGTVPSNSTVSVPTPGGQIKHCDLTGRYLYVEMFVLPEKFFIIHVDLAIKDRQPGVRLTITNMDKEYSVSGGNVLKIPYQTDRSVWTIVCIDLEHHLESYGLFPKGAIKSFKGCHTVKGIQVCANLVLRGIYTSPNIYDWDSLPKQMSFKLVKGGRWSDQYNFIYLPASTSPEEIRKRQRKEEREQENEPGNRREEPSEALIKPPSSEIRPQPSNSRGVVSPIQPNSQSLMQQQIQELPQEPFVDLNYVLAFSPIHNPDILFQDNTIYYSSGSLVVIKSLETGHQDFLQGHTDYICAMDSMDNWIVTVQKGPKAIVRVWINHKCIYSFQAPQEKVQQLRLNRKKHLAMVGIDIHNRQVISIFDISQVESKKRAVQLARQVSDFNILTIKFSPVEHDKLVSCGRENIRFWRIKSEHLPGAPVILKHHARNTIFTVLDFEYAYDNPNPKVQQEKIKSVYIGSQNGLLFQVNYHTHELEEVYKLHDSAICSLMMSMGFCVTGGEDQVLRVWPLDFGEYILEAEHEGIITSLSLSEDGMHVACGTNSGGLGILDLTNHNYKTVLRSHTDNVVQITPHDYSGSVITLSTDLTIRLWDPERLEQTYEFLYAKEDPCTCIAGNPLSMFFAAGFKSGMLRIFDIEKTCISEELSQHQEAIEFVLYSPDGKFLAVLEKKLAMLYSPLHSHQAVKHLPTEMPSKYQSCSFSPDSSVLAVIGDSGTHINIWQLKTLQLTGKIFTGRVVRKLKFSPDGGLWALFEDASIRRYNLTNMTIEAEMQALHRGALTDCDFDLHNYILFTVGEDSLLKVWDYSFQREPHQVSIGHVGIINGVLARDGKVWTIGSEGILQWNIKKDLPQYEPPFLKTRAANFIKNNIREERPPALPPALQSVDIDKSLQPLNSPSGEEELINFSQNPQRESKQHEGPVMFSQRLKKRDNDELMVVGEPKFIPQRVDMIFLQKIMDFKKSKKRDHKPRISNQPPAINIEYGLPQKHFYREELEAHQKEYQQKIQLIKQNVPQFKIRYLMGLEAFSHDHIVWNYVFGWYAYVLDNLIIVEQLGKERAQKIIPMPEKIGQLLLTSDMKRLICCSAFNSIKKPKGLGDSASEQDSQMSADSSGSGEQAQAAFANIYVMSREFEVDKKLSFHPRGVQSMCLSENGKYLVSIGNFRECTVCVWEMASGKLKASSYTLDKLNDVKAMDWASEGRNLQFATVGRDQVHFWALDRDDKLEYHDVFIPKGQNGEIPQITACEYIYVGESPKLLLGLTNGYIMAVEYGSFRVVLSRLLANGPIIGIRNVGKKIIVTSADGSIYFWSYESVLKDISLPNFSKVNLQFSVNGIAMDPEGEEGLVATSEGIFYANLKEQYTSLLVGGFTSPPFFTKILNAQYFITSHENGRLKLWNLETGEQLRTYKWKSACREALFDESLNKLFCFLENNNQIKLVNLNKFTRDEIYTFDQTVKPETKADDYAVKTYHVTMGGRPAKWVFMKKGEVHAFELVKEGRKKLMKLQKVLEFGYEVESVEIYNEKNMIFTVSSSGLVSAYVCDLVGMNKYTLTIMDKVSLAQVAADIKTGKNIESVPDLPHEARIRVAPSHTINEIYFAVCNQLQFVYFRNYMKRVTLYKIALSGLPMSVSTYETKKVSQVLVGLADGSVEVINAMEPDQRYKVDSVVNGPVQAISTVRSKQTVLLTHDNALALYTL